MARYKLLLGAHCQRQEGWKPSEKEVEEAKMRGTSPRAPSEVFHAGDVFESDLDLVGMFGHEKFLLIEGKPTRGMTAKVKSGEEMRFPPAEGPDAPVAGAQTEGAGSAQPDFDSMTLRDLKAYAEEEEIDLKDAKTKDDVVRVLKRKRK